MTTLDRTDFEILDCLQKNARISNKALAAAVGLAPSSCHERVRRLFDSGVVRGAHADIDPRAVGVGLEALYMLELSKHERGVVDRFLDLVVALPEVRSAYLISGRYDIVVHVTVRDTQHLRDLALDQFTSQVGVTRIETSIIFDSRRGLGLPITEGAQSDA